MRRGQQPVRSDGPAGFVLDTRALGEGFGCRARDAAHVRRQARALLVASRQSAVFMPVKRLTITRPSHYVGRTVDSGEDGSGTKR
jgi:hypothetical protein